MQFLALIILLAGWRLADHMPMLVELPPNFAALSALIALASVMVLALGGCVWFLANGSSWRSIVRFRIVQVAWFAAVSGLLATVFHSGVFAWVALPPLMLAWVASWAALAPAFQMADGRSPSLASAAARIRRRALAWLQGPALVYLAPIFACVLAVEWVERSPGDYQSFTMIGVAFLATISIWALAIRFQLQNSLRTLRPDEAPTKRLIKSAAENVGVKFRSILVWNTSGAFMNAAVAGFGSFQSLLVTDVLLRELSPCEVGAIVRHEAAHVRRRHWLYRLAAIAFPISFWICFYQLTHWEDAFFWSITAPALTVSWMALVVSWLCRRLEFDADKFACLDSHGRFDKTASEALAGALTTIMQKSNADMNQSGWLHPSVADRVRRLTSQPDTQRFVRITDTICRALLLGNIVLLVVAWLPYVVIVEY